MQRKEMTRLMGLQFKVVYKKGKENIAANALSRVPHLMLIQAVSEAHRVWLQEVLNAYHTDQKAQELLISLLSLAQMTKAILCTKALYTTNIRSGSLKFQHYRQSSLQLCIL
jgi:hypothetical protein